MAEPRSPVLPRPCTIDQAARSVAGALRAGGIDCPDQEARELVLMATALTPLVMVTNSRRPVSEAEFERIETVLSRRLAREPLTRIAGQREFYGRDFLLSPATLDPRPDTETLVEAVLQIVDDEGWRQRPLRLLDPRHRDRVPSSPCWPSCLWR